MTPTAGSRSASASPTPSSSTSSTNLVVPPAGRLAHRCHAVQPLPGTGPYQVASVNHGDVTLIRNPYFAAVVGRGPARGLPGRASVTVSLRLRVGRHRRRASDGRAQAYVRRTGSPRPVTSRPGWSTRTTSYRCSTSSRTRRSRPSTTCGSGRPSATRWTVAGSPISPAAQSGVPDAPPSFPGYVPVLPPPVRAGHRAVPGAGHGQGQRAGRRVGHGRDARSPCTHRRYRLLGDIARYTRSVLERLGYQVDVTQVPEIRRGSRRTRTSTPCRSSVPLGWLADYPSAADLLRRRPHLRRRAEVQPLLQPDGRGDGRRRRGGWPGPTRPALSTSGVKVDHMLTDDAACSHPDRPQIGTFVVSPECRQRPDPDRTRRRSSTRCG